MEVEGATTGGGQGESPSQVRQVPTREELRSGPLKVISPFPLSQSWPVASASRPLTGRTDFTLHCP